MKVLFMCGSLEPGHDGVGDYTRELAGALNVMGWKTKIIALKDRSVNSVLEQHQQSSNEVVDVVRISKALSLSNRKFEYNKAIQNFNPDIISLQFVPYAFSSKGIPFYLPGFLKLSKSSVKWHFMIHESYIDGNLNFKDRLIKKSQIWILKSLVLKLNPLIVHTSTLRYQSYLKAIGIKCSILGLFGNIHIADSVEREISTKTFRGVYFGVSPESNNYQIFIQAFKALLSKTHGDLEIVLCGNLGEKGNQFASALRQGIDSERFFLIEKGRMNTNELSRLFSKADFGIARVRADLLGKSGSAIALLEHGLPLWLPFAASSEEIASKFDFRVNQCFVDLIEIWELKQKFEPGSRLNEIATLFKNSLLEKNEFATNETA